jgi:hypothetical protein
LPTASPLTAKEASGLIDARVINTSGLCMPATALKLLPASK